MLSWASQNENDAGVTMKNEIAPCPRLRSLATEFHAMIVAECPRCRGIGPQCMVELMEQAANPVPPSVHLGEVVADKVRTCESKIS
jgi:hypothetical protein